MVIKRRYIALVLNKAYLRNTFYRDRYILTFKYVSPLFPKVLFKY